jgi:hypothetical protein
MIFPDFQKRWIKRMDIEPSLLHLLDSVKLLDFLFFLLPIVVSLVKLFILQILSEMFQVCISGYQFPVCEAFGKGGFQFDEGFFPLVAAGMDTGKIIVGLRDCGPHAYDGFKQGAPVLILLPDVLDDINRGELLGMADSRF